MPPSPGNDVEFTPGIVGTKVLGPPLGRMARFGNGKEKAPDEAGAVCPDRTLSSGAYRGFIFGSVSRPGCRMVRALPQATWLGPRFGPREPGPNGRDSAPAVLAGANRRL
jgi:hypothetical protein